MPLITLGMFAAVHFQALRLWRRGISSAPGGRCMSADRLPAAVRLTRRGRPAVVLPDGARHVIEAGPGAAAIFIVTHARMARRLLTGGRLGRAEAYLRGMPDTPDLLAVMMMAGPADGRFKRRWEYDRACCETGFRAGWTGAGPTGLVHPSEQRR
jgi:hypothetical protein